MISIPAVTVSLSYTLNGSTQVIVQDTVTPANNRPLPVILLNSSGEFGSAVNPIHVAGLSGTLGQQTMANSSPVVIASDQSAVAISAASLPLPTGAATETTLAAMSAKLPASVGAKVSAASLSIVFASDITGFPVTQSGTWNINDITGTVSLPTGAATETTLASIDSKLNSLGQKASVASVPVVLASDQSSININNISGTVSLPSGAATETTLAALNNKFGSIGQHASAGSTSVVIASDQSPVSVTPGVVAATTQDFGSIDFSTLSNSYATIMTLTADRKIIAIMNSLDQPVSVSLDAGSTDFCNLDGESIVLDLGTSGMKLNSGAVIQVKYSGSAPTQGSVRVSVLG